MVVLSRIMLSTQNPVAEEMEAVSTAKRLIQDTAWESGVNG
jgi:hypothetical protein